MKEWKEFFITHGGIDYNEKTLNEYFKKGLFVAGYDRTGLMYLGLFRISGELMEVDEVTIRPDMQFKNILKYMAIKALQKFPFINEFCYERLRKYEDRDIMKFDIYRFIGIKNREVINGR